MKLCYNECKQGRDCLLKPRPTKIEGSNSHLPRGEVHYTTKPTQMSVLSSHGHRSRHVDGRIEPMVSSLRRSGLTAVKTLLTTVTCRRFALSNPISLCLIMRLFFNTNWYYHHNSTKNLSFCFFLSLDTNKH